MQNFIFLKGFFLSLSLIMAIGAQNAFVLRQGIAKNNVFYVCLVCFLCDFVLILAGIFGVGEVIKKNLKRYGYQKKNIFRLAPIPRPVISRSKHSAGPTSYSGRRSGGHLAKLILNRHCNFPILNDHILR